MNDEEQAEEELEEEQLSVRRFFPFYDILCCQK